jgi:cytosine/adenosine deaminase-related metal-dependent hydrolase
MFITASRIHSGKDWLPEGSAIEIAEDGTIISITDTTPSEATIYSGILCPGFVNVHCHTELSHMKGIIPEHTGLVPFLQTVSLHRNEHTAEEKKDARFRALDELYNNGIVAVGDIANTADTVDIRAEDKLHFHTFVESLGFTDANAERSFGYASSIYEQFKAQKQGQMRLSQSITPHAPYSVSKTLFGLIDAHTGPGTIAIHNQECEAEGQFFMAKEGAIRDLLKSLGIDDTPFTPTGLSSIRSYLQWMTHNRRFIFVHNTYTPKEDIQHVHALVKEAYWCLCPNANLYIEHRLPDIDMLMNERANICIGTDSLASSHQLSVMAELHAIKASYPGIGWDTLLRWATNNGANALGLDHVAGTLETGKKPGIVLIPNIETSAEVRRLF